MVKYASTQNKTMMKISKVIKEHMELNIDEMADAPTVNSGEPENVLMRQAI